MVTEQDLDDSIAYMGHQVFRWHPPTTLLIENSAYASQNHLGVSATKRVATTLDRLRPLGDVTDGHIGYPEDATLFLHGAAVAEHAEGVALQRDEFKKAKGG